MLWGVAATLKISLANAVMGFTDPIPGIVVNSSLAVEQKVTLEQCASSCHDDASCVSFNWCCGADAAGNTECGCTRNGWNRNYLVMPGSELGCVHYNRIIARDDAKVHPCTPLSV